MKDLVKEYKTQIAIIVGALIVAFAIYFSMTYEVRTKINRCIDDQYLRAKKQVTRLIPKEYRDYCTGQVLKFGRW